MSQTPPLGLILLSHPFCHLCCRPSLSTIPSSSWDFHIPSRLLTCSKVSAVWTDCFMAGSWTQGLLSIAPVGLLLLGPAAARGSNTLWPTLVLICSQGQRLYRSMCALALSSSWTGSGPCPQLACSTTHDCYPWVSLIERHLPTALVCMVGIQGPAAPQGSHLSGPTPRALVGPS